MYKNTAFSRKNKALKADTNLQIFLINVTLYYNPQTILLSDHRSNRDTMTLHSQHKAKRLYQTQIPSYIISSLRNRCF